MTIQNIDDVMDRIMSLNRNLTEDSLKVLLSASGWDREDISEGLRIFRNKSKSGVQATPIPNKVFELDPDQKPAPDLTNVTNTNQLGSNDIPTPRPDNYNALYKQADNNQSDKTNPYTFNLNSKLNNNQEVQHEDIVSDKMEDDKDKVNTQINNNPFILKNNTSLNRNTEVSTTQKIENTSSKVEIKRPQNISTNHSPHRGAKIIFYILLLIVLGFLALYLFYTPFTNLLNQSLSNKPSQINQSENLPNNSQNNNQSINNNLPVVINGQSLITQNSNDINQLRNDINSLREDFANLKNSGSGEAKTIVKYISQRGPAGPAGRGILTAGASSTGFILTYTDGYQQLIPFATDTRLSNLNVEEICFRNTATSTETSYLSGTSTDSLLNNFDLCLNKSQVLNILQN